MEKQDEPGSREQLRRTPLSQSPLLRTTFQQHARVSPRPGAGHLLSAVTLSCLDQRPQLLNQYTALWLNWAAKSCSIHRTLSISMHRQLKSTRTQEEYRHLYKPSDYAWVKLITVKRGKPSTKQESNSWARHSQGWRQRTFTQTHQ